MRQPRSVQLAVFPFPIVFTNQSLERFPLGNGSSIRILISQESETNFIYSRSNGYRKLPIIIIIIIPERVEKGGLTHPRDYQRPHLPNNNTPIPTENPSRRRGGGKGREERNVVVATRGTGRGRERMERRLTRHTYVSCRVN